MYDLTRFTVKDATRCGAAIRRLTAGAHSLEDAADTIVRHLYDYMVDEQTGVKACVMVRLFKTCYYHDLPRELQIQAKAKLGDLLASPKMKCLVLAGTAGLEPPWNDINQARRFRVTPLPSEAFVSNFPMISHLFRQFGLDINLILKPDPSLLIDLEQDTFNIFHVSKAMGSAYIPNQDDFIHPYGVESVMGFGGILPWGELFAVIMFTRVQVPRSTAEMLSPLALSVKKALLPFAEKSGKADEADWSGRVDSELSAVEQLLAIQEENIIQLSDRYELAQDDLQEAQEKLERWVEQRTAELSQLMREAEQGRILAEAANEAKSQLMANLSSEIRTPLNEVSGLTELLKATTLDQEQRDLVRKIHHANDDLLKLADNILDFSRIETGQLAIENRPFDLREVLYRLLDVFTLRANEKGIRLELDFMGRIPTVLIGDALRVRQVVSNLLDNALRFTESGNIRVVVQRVDSPELAPPNVRLHFTVRDTGSGMTRDQMDRLVQAFNRREALSPGIYGGLGLGLAISRRLVELMGGDLWAESEGRGRGSIFHFTVVGEETGGTKPFAEPGAFARMRYDRTFARKYPLNIMLVEDNIINQRIATRLLGRLGYDVHLASSGKQALKILERRHFDVIFMDVRMPGMDGFETTDQIRRTEKPRASGIPRPAIIIALESYVSEENRIHCLEAGMDDCLNKPVQVDDLVKVLTWASEQVSQDTEKSRG